MSIDQAKKAFVVYQNFVSLTNVMRGKADKIMLEFGFTIKLPQYYTPDASLVNTLKICIESKQRNPSQSPVELDQISKQLRGGMNRDQFQTGPAVSFNSAIGGGSSKPSQQEKPVSFKQSKQEAEDSDSGEDFEYYDEDEEGGQGSTSADSNFDILQFISNMDAPGTKAAPISLVQNVP